MKDTHMRTEKFKCRNSSIYWNIQHRLQQQKITFTCIPFHVFFFNVRPSHLT